MFYKSFVDEIEKLAKSRDAQIQDALAYAAKQRDKGVKGYERVGGRYKKGDKPWPKSPKMQKITMVTDKPHPALIIPAGMGAALSLSGAIAEALSYRGKKGRWSPFRGSVGKTKRAKLMNKWGRGAQRIGLPLTLAGSGGDIIRRVVKKAKGEYD